MAMKTFKETSQNSPKTKVGRLKTLSNFLETIYSLIVKKAGGTW